MDRPGGTVLVIRDVVGAGPAIERRSVMPHSPPSLDGEIPKHRSSIDRLAARKAKGLCPLCGAKVPQNARGTRRMRNCTACGGCLNKDITCPHCRTQRVWTGKRGCVCHGCGKTVDRAA